MQTTLDGLTQQITDLQEQAAASEALANELQEQHKRLLSWAEMFDSASPQEKKMVAFYLIKAVTLTRNYGIQVEFNISEAQYPGSWSVRLVEAGTPAADRRQCSLGRHPRLSR